MTLPDMPPDWLYLLGLQEPLEGVVHLTNRRRGLWWRLLAVVALILLVCAGLGWQKYQAFQGFKGMAAAMKDPVQTVSATAAGFQTWQADMQAVGSLRAANGVDLAFETAGIVDSIRFKSGDDVAAGTILATMRPDDLTGRRDALDAQIRLAEITIERDRKQFAAQAVAQATLDADTANLKNLKAQQAQVGALLDERVIRAPFAGHLGIRQIDLGQYVTAGTQVVTLQALDPIYVDYTLPQQALQELKLNEAAQIKIDTYPDQTFTGVISAINPRVDPQTRNIQVRATVKNPQHKLLPGMYATVSITSGQPQSYLTLPQTAITFNPYGSTAYVVEDKGKGADGKPELRAHQTFITTGATRGDQVAVIKGLKEGDMVVTSGQTKLRNGARLVIDNSLQPASDAAPTPQDH